MVLVNTVGDLAFPEGATPKLVGIAAFCKQKVAWRQPISGDLVLGCGDGLDKREIQRTILHVGYCKVRDDSSSLALNTAALRNPRGDVGHFTQRCSFRPPF